MDALNANPDLLSYEMYSVQFNKPPSKMITFALRAKLVSMKLVSPDHFM